MQNQITGTVVPSDYGGPRGEISQKLHLHFTFVAYIPCMRIEPRQPEPRPLRPQFGTQEHEDADTGETSSYEGAPARLNDSEREALLLNIDVSLRVHTRAQ